MAVKGHFRADGFYRRDRERGDPAPSPPPPPKSEGDYLARVRALGHGRPGYRRLTQLRLKRVILPGDDWAQINGRLYKIDDLSMPVRSFACSAACDTERGGGGGCGGDGCGGGAGGGCSGADCGAGAGASGCGGEGCSCGADAGSSAAGSAGCGGAGCGGAGGCACDSGGCSCAGGGCGCQGDACGQSGGGFGGPGGGPGGGFGGGTGAGQGGPGGGACGCGGCNCSGGGCGSCDCSGGGCGGCSAGCSSGGCSGCGGACGACGNAGCGGSGGIDTPDCAMSDVGAVADVGAPAGFADVGAFSEQDQPDQMVGPDVPSDFFEFANPQAAFNAAMSMPSIVGPVETAHEMGFMSAETFNAIHDVNMNTLATVPPGSQQAMLAVASEKAIQDQLSPTFDPGLPPSDPTLGFMPRADCAVSSDGSPVDFAQQDTGPSDFAAAQDFSQPSGLDFAQQDFTQAPSDFAQGPSLGAVSPDMGFAQPTDFASQGFSPSGGFMPDTSSTFAGGGFDTTGGGFDTTPTGGGFDTTPIGGPTDIAGLTDQPGGFDTLSMLQQDQQDRDERSERGGLTQLASISPDMLPMNERNPLQGGPGALSFMGALPGDLKTQQIENQPTLTQLAENVPTDRGAPRASDVGDYGIPKPELGPSPYESFSTDKPALEPYARDEHDEAPRPPQGDEHDDQPRGTPVGGDYAPDKPVSTPDEKGTTRIGEPNTLVPSGPTANVLTTQPSQEPPPADNTQPLAPGPAPPGDTTPYGPPRTQEPGTEPPIVRDERTAPPPNQEPPATERARPTQGPGTITTAPPFGPGDLIPVSPQGTGPRVQGEGLAPQGPAGSQLQGLVQQQQDQQAQAEQQQQDQQKKQQQQDQLQRQQGLTQQRAQATGPTQGLTRATEPTGAAPTGGVTTVPEEATVAARTTTAGEQRKSAEPPKTALPPTTPERAATLPEAPQVALPETPPKEAPPATKEEAEKAKEESKTEKGFFGRAMEAVQQAIIPSAEAKTRAGRQGAPSQKMSALTKQAIKEGQAATREGRQMNTEYYGTGGKMEGGPTDAMDKPLNKTADVFNGNKPWITASKARGELGRTGTVDVTDKRTGETKTLPFAVRDTGSAFPEGTEGHTDFAVDGKNDKGRFEFSNVQYDEEAASDQGQQKGVAEKRAEWAKTSRETAVASRAERARGERGQFSRSNMEAAERRQPLREATQQQLDFTVEPSVNTTRMNPNAVNAFNRAFHDYVAQGGDPRSAVATSGYRPATENQARQMQGETPNIRSQEAIRRDIATGRIPPQAAAPVGTSKHGTGNGIDLTGAETPGSFRQWLETNGAKYNIHPIMGGLHPRGKGDKPHVEYRGPEGGTMVARTQTDMPMRREAGVTAGSHAPQQPTRTAENVPRPPRDVPVPAPPQRPAGAGERPERPPSTEVPGKPTEGPVTAGPRPAPAPPPAPAPTPMPGPTWDQTFGPPPVGQERGRAGAQAGPAIERGLPITAGVTQGPDVRGLAGTPSGAGIERAIPGVTGGVQPGPGVVGRAGTPSGAAIERSIAQGGIGGVQPGPGVLGALGTQAGLTQMPGAPVTPVERGRELAEMGERPPVAGATSAETEERFPRGEAIPAGERIPVEHPGALPQVAGPGVGGTPPGSEPGKAVPGLVQGPGAIGREAAEPRVEEMGGQLPRDIVGGVRPGAGIPGAPGTQAGETRGGFAPGTPGPSYTGQPGLTPIAEPTETAGVEGAPGTQAGLGGRPATDMPIGTRMEPGAADEHEEAPRPEGEKPPETAEEKPPEGGPQPLGAAAPPWPGEKPATKTEEQRAVEHYDRADKAIRDKLTGDARKQADQFAGYATKKDKADLLTGKISPLDFMVRLANREPGIMVTRTPGMIMQFAGDRVRSLQQTVTRVQGEMAKERAAEQAEQKEYAGKAQEYATGREAYEQRLSQAAAGYPYGQTLPPPPNTTPPPVVPGAPVTVGPPPSGPPPMASTEPPFQGGVNPFAPPGANRESTRGDFWGAPTLREIPPPAGGFPPSPFGTGIPPEPPPLPPDAELPPEEEQRPERETIPLPQTRPAPPEPPYTGPAVTDFPFVRPTEPPTAPPAVGPQARPSTPAPSPTVPGPQVAPGPQAAPPGPQAPAVAGPAPTPGLQQIAADVGYGGAPPEPVKQRITDMVRTNPAQVAQMMDSDPSIGPMLASIYSPEELQAMFDDVGFSQGGPNPQPPPQRPPMPVMPVGGLGGMGMGGMPIGGGSQRPMAQGGLVDAPGYYQQGGDSDIQRSLEEFRRRHGLDKAPEMRPPPMKVKPTPRTYDWRTAEGVDERGAPLRQPSRASIDWRTVPVETEQRKYSPLGSGAWPNKGSGVETPQEVFRTPPDFQSPQGDVITSPRQLPPQSGGMEVIGGERWGLAPAPMYEQGGLVDVPHLAGGGLGIPQMNTEFKQAHFTGLNTRAAIPKAGHLHALQRMPGVHLINSASVPGRTDRIPMRARTGSYVLPADVVSGMGQGNTQAGAQMWGKMIGHSIGPMGVANAIKARSMNAVKRPNLSMPSPRVNPKNYMGAGLGFAGQGITGRGAGGFGFAEGGDTGDDNEWTPIITAGGECLIDPEIVEALGGGDHEEGKRILADSVKDVRRQTIAHLRKLPGPVE